MIQFLAADERRCLDERLKAKRPDDAPSGLVTEPREYLPKIEPGTDMADFVAALHQENDKDLHLLRSRGCLTGPYNLFSTDNHKLGIGPSSTRNGDQVWVLNGARFPVILRSPGTGLLIVVGPAYVHGVPIHPHYSVDTELTKHHTTPKCSRVVFSIYLHCNLACN